MGARWLLSDRESGMQNAGCGRPVQHVLAAGWGQRGGAMENPLTGGSLDDVPTCPNGYDPIDNEALRDPWADLSELRDRCPVSKVQTGGVDVVVVTRFD